MDFLIGGIPRGGTSITSSIFSFHPDIYCYVFETHLLALVLALTAHPIPPELQEKELRNRVRQFFREQLVDRPNRNRRRGGQQGQFYFNERQTDEFSDGISNMVFSGLPARKLALDSLELLRDTLSRGLPHRRIYGEKTPNNVIAIDALGSLNTRVNFFVAREPFGALRSMIRAGQSGRWFGERLEENIGVYLRWGEAIARGIETNKGKLLLYESLLESSANEFTGLFESLGVQQCSEPAAKAAAAFRRTHKNPVEDFSAFERWAIWNLTRNVRESLGYGDARMRVLGAPVDLMNGPIGIQPNTIRPLYGFYSRVKPRGVQAHDTPNRISNVWTAPEGGLVLYVNSSARELQLEFERDLPTSSIFSTAQTTVSISNHGKIIEQIDFKHNYKRKSICISLKNLLPVSQFHSTRLFRIDLKAAPSFVPMLFSSLPNRISTRSLLLRNGGII